MARLWYGGTPADFVVGQGAAAEILDDEGAETGDTGTAALLPIGEGPGFTAYMDAALTASTADLLDAGGSPISEVTPETGYARRGGIPAFQGPDGHEGPLWLSGDGETGYRLEPDSGPLYARVGDVESGLSGLAVTDLEGWSDSMQPDSENAWPRYNPSTGVYEPGPAPSVGSATWDDIAGRPSTFPSTWGSVSGKPSGFPPEAHDHDGRYYTKAEVDDISNGGGIATMPTTHRFESAPGVYPARETPRSDLSIFWHGTLEPPFANEQSATDWVADSVAMAGVDIWIRAET